MKRFVWREIVLLTSPLLVVGVAGWLLSRRRVLPPPTPLHAVFRLEKPTVLEAFDGADSVMNIELQGAQAATHTVYRSDYGLEVRTPTNTKVFFGSRGSEGIWRKVWKGDWNATHFSVNSRFISKGALTFSWTGSIAPRSGPVAAKLPHLSGRWRVDRTEIKPFAFNKMARTPLVVLRWVKVTLVMPGNPTNVIGECVFELTGAAMNEQTPTEFGFSGSAPLAKGMSAGVGWGTGMNVSGTPESATRRVREWEIECVPGGKVHVAGRVSADGRWPLAFEIAPFDVSKVKVGQKLKFKSWPAPVPAGVN